MSNSKQILTEIIDDIDTAIDTLNNFNPSVKTSKQPIKPTFKPNPNIGEGEPSQENLDIRQSMLDINKAFDKDYRNIDISNPDKAKNELRMLIDKYKAQALLLSREIAVNALNRGLDKARAILNQKGINANANNKTLLKSDKAQKLIAYQQQEINKIWETLYLEYSSDIERRTYYGSSIQHKKQKG